MEMLHRPICHRSGNLNSWRKGAKRPLWLGRNPQIHPDLPRAARIPPALPRWGTAARSPRRMEPSWAGCITRLSGWLAWLLGESCSCFTPGKGTGKHEAQISVASDSLQLAPPVSWATRIMSQPRLAPALMPGRGRSGDWLDQQPGLWWGAQEEDLEASLQNPRLAKSLLQHRCKQQGLAGAAQEHALIPSPLCGVTVQGWHPHSPSRPSPLPSSL